MADEKTLSDRLRQLEGIFAGVSQSGVSAAELLARMLERLRAAEQVDPPKEYRFTLADRWSVTLFMALLRRYQITPYRHRGQRRTTVMAQVTKRFVDETLWPEFLELSKILDQLLDEVTRRVIAKAVCEDGSEAEVREEVKQPPGPGLIEYRET